MNDKKLRIMVIGAHPDDCDITAGGAAAKWAAAGHCVKFVSATNGATGHHSEAPHVLAQRRAAEAKASAAIIGIDVEILPIQNGMMEPSNANRWTFIRLIRLFEPDLILTHRPNDYHPDHRITSQLVADSSYLVRVPYNAPEAPPLRYSPAIAYVNDNFQKPIPFQPDVVVAIDDVIDKKIDMIRCHTSQVFEWLPWADGCLDKVPSDPAGRRQFVIARWGARSRAIADKFRDKLIARYGRQEGLAVQYAEAFEGCEYGAKLDAPAIERLFGGM